MLCGNVSLYSCVYYQWSFDLCGNLLGVFFCCGQKGVIGMVKDFDFKCYGLCQLCVDSYKGLVFVIFSEIVELLLDYIGVEMCLWIDCIFYKFIVYFGCMCQYFKLNWKFYLENVKDLYYVSLLYLFYIIFNIFCVGMKVCLLVDKYYGLYSIIIVIKNEVEMVDVYKQQEICFFDEGFLLQDLLVLGQIKEFEELIINYIQFIFLQLVVQQIYNILVVCQLLFKGLSNFELVFYFFGYVDDIFELCVLCIKQVNLVGLVGYILMEDIEVIELVQCGIVCDFEYCLVIDMVCDNFDQEDILIIESLICKFWMGYQKLMGFLFIEKV